MLDAAEDVWGGVDIFADFDEAALTACLDEVQAPASAPAQNGRVRRGGAK
jgi:hypothetical protein